MWFSELTADNLKAHDAQATGNARRRTDSESTRGAVKKGTKQVLLRFAPIETSSCKFLNRDVVCATNTAAKKIQETLRHGARCGKGWCTTGSTDLEFGSVLAELSGWPYDATSRGSALLFVQTFVKTVGCLPKILDAGCGDGAFLQNCLNAFAEEGFADGEGFVTGINLMQEEYDSGTLPRSCMLCGNMDGLTADPPLWKKVQNRGPFDVILAQCSLEHLGDPLGFILNSLKNLNAGGIFVAGPMAHGRPGYWGIFEEDCVPCLTIEGYENYKGMHKTVEILNSQGRLVASSRLWTLGVRNYTDSVGGIEQLFPLEHSLLPNAKYKFKECCISTIGREEEALACRT